MLRIDSPKLTLPIPAPSSSSGTRAVIKSSLGLRPIALQHIMLRKSSGMLRCVRPDNGCEIANGWAAKFRHCQGKWISRARFPVVLEHHIRAIHCKWQHGPCKTRRTSKLREPQLVGHNSAPARLVSPSSSAPFFLASFLGGILALVRSRTCSVWWESRPVSAGSILTPTVVWAKHKVRQCL